MSIPESEEVRQERERQSYYAAMDAKYGPRYYDMDGKPLSMWDWAMNLELRMNRHVGDTYLKWRGSVFRVSTVWLGLDHSFSPRPHRPLIFETMVFQDGDMGGYDGICERYSTKAEALAGHRRTVRWVRKSLAAEPRAKPLIHNGSKP